MFDHPLFRLLFPVLLLSCVAVSQVLNLPHPGDAMSTSMSMNAIQSAQLDFAFFQIDTRNAGSSPLEGASGSISKLDLEAGRKFKVFARKGYYALGEQAAPTDQ
jgi:hypothetical protein